MPAVILSSYFGFDIARGVFFLPDSATAASIPLAMRRHL
jgi:hypothetical protein